ncbi:unnamed protein product [Phytophthora lilii]|uniref:Unnamed protein product n=1 Tax=Phytophthora lilii TaxID=2077276 RepID=A0A9W6X791_9STRA|nr:unnamed protein product [Phytophthora lilii]
MAAEKGLYVRDVVLDMVKDKKCGYTRTDVDPKPVPTDGKVKWWGNLGGFTHRGPCEIHIDDKMVLHGNDCSEEFPGGHDGSDQMSEMPVDFSLNDHDSNVKCSSSAQEQTTDSPSTQNQLAEASFDKDQGDNALTTTTQTRNAGSSTEEQTTDAPSTDTQSTEVPSDESQTDNAPATLDESESQKTDQKCNAPARRLREKKKMAL